MVLAADWLFDTGLSQAAPAEVVAKSGVLKMTLTSDERMIKYGNTTRWAMTYNGTFPAPTMREWIRCMAAAVQIHLLMESFRQYLK